MATKTNGITPLLIGVSEAAETLGIGRSTLYMMMEERGLKSVRIGRRRLVRVTDIQTLVDNLVEVA